MKSDSIHEQTAGQAPADYTACITPADSVTVGQYGTWDIVVTVGAQGSGWRRGAHCAATPRKAALGRGQRGCHYQRSRHERTG